MATIHDIIKEAIRNPYHTEKIEKVKVYKMSSDTLKEESEEVFDISDKTSNIYEDVEQISHHVTGNTLTIYIV